MKVEQIGFSGELDIKYERNIRFKDGSNDFGFRICKDMFVIICNAGHLQREKAGNRVVEIIFSVWDMLYLSCLLTSKQIY